MAESDSFYAAVWLVNKLNDVPLRIEPWAIETRGLVLLLVVGWMGVEDRRGEDKMCCCVNMEHLLVIIRL